LVICSPRSSTPFYIDFYNIFPIKGKSTPILEHSPSKREKYLLPRVVIGAGAGRRLRFILLLFYFFTGTAARAGKLTLARTD
jgi:hypothetical protein